MQIALAGGEPVGSVRLFNETTGLTLLAVSIRYLDTVHLHGGVLLSDGILYLSHPTLHSSTHPYKSIEA